MDRKEFLKEIGSFVVPNNSEVISENACWLDHSPCPYGFPKGRFELRPTNFCNLDEVTGMGCPKLADEEFFQVFREEMIENRVKKELQDYVKNEGLLLSDFIDRAVEKFKEKAESEGKAVGILTLERAADIIREEEDDGIDVMLIEIER